MKTHGRYIIIATFVALAKAGAVLAAPCAPAAAAPDPFSAPSSLVYPNFCDIPPKPTDIRPAAAFKTQVVGTRVAGAVVVRQTAPETFTLSGTEGFAEGAKREAAPPRLTLTSSGAVAGVPERAPTPISTPIRKSS